MSQVSITSHNCVTTVTYAVTNIMKREKKWKENLKKNLKKILVSRTGPGPDHGTV